MIQYDLAMENVCAVILAAGKGTRMNSQVPKSLLKISKKPLIFWTLEKINKAGIKEQVVVVGFKSEEVKKEIFKAGFDVKFAKQKVLNGTARSLQTALTKIDDSTKTVLVLFSDDSAFYKPETLIEFLKYHIKKHNNVTFLVSNLKKISDIGGLDLDNKGHVIGVLTRSQLIQKGVKQYPVLCGAFCFNLEWLKNNIKKIKMNDYSKEYPLPQIYKIAISEGSFVDTFPLKDSQEWMSVNTIEEFNRAKKIKKYV